MKITPEHFDAFAADLRAVCEKHGVVLSSREEIAACDPTGWTIDERRDSTKFPEGADEMDDVTYAPEMYVAVSPVDVMCDDLRANTLDVPRRYRY